MSTAEPVSDGVTEEMLNAGQERLCQIASRTHFDDYEEAEKYKAMRGEDPIFKAVLDYMRDTQALPLEECAKLFSLRLKALAEQIPDAPETEDQLRQLLKEAYSRIEQSGEAV